MAVANKTAAITAMVREGRSAGQMAMALACSRNMILSHARRYGVKLAPPVEARRQAPTARRRKQRRAQVLFQVDPFVPATTWLPHCQPVSFLERASHQCAWPVGEAGGSKQMFCGDHVARRGYCERHAKMGVGVRHSCATESRHM